MKYNFKVDMSTDNSASIILRHINPGSCVLEFGPATGYMTRFMKEELGCTVYCIEKDREAAELAKNYCKKMIITDINSMEWLSELQTGFFDHIIFADVLEHLENPWKVLKAAVYYLKENGTVLTSVPNISHNAIIMELLQGRFDYQPLGLLDDSHIRFFTQKSIFNLLQKAGLLPIKWLGTIVHPEHTEFQQNYNYFPDPVQRFLKNRENAHVYQFITVSKREEEETVNDRCSDFSIVNDEYNNVYLQVFWEGKDGFAEDCSIKVPLKYDTDFIQYDLILPPEAKGKLRIDPGTGLAYIEIKKIALHYDVTFEPMVQRLGGESFCNIVPGPGIIRLEDSNLFRFITFDNDPQLFLEGIYFPNYEGSKVLRIDMKATQIIPDNVLENIFIQVTKEIEVNKKLIDYYNSKLSKMQEKLNNKDKQVRQFTIELSKARENLNEKDEQIKQYITELSRMQKELANQVQQIKQQTCELAKKKLELLNKEQQLTNVLNSYSWKLTSPFRYIYNKIVKRSN